MKRFWLFLICALLMLFCVIHCGAQPYIYVKHKGYDVVYNNHTKVPCVVHWLLVFPDFNGRNKIASRHFKIDAQLPAPRVKDSDFKGSGYVRGHLCPVGDRDSDKDLMKETFFLSNVCPMSMVANSGGWKMTEDSCREICRRGCYLQISAGTLFFHRDTTRIGAHNVCVPHALWKYAECMIHQDEYHAWLVENNRFAMRPIAITKEELVQLLENEPMILSYLRNKVWRW